MLCELLTLASPRSNNYVVLKHFPCTFRKQDKTYGTLYGSENINHTINFILFSESTGGVLKEYFVVTSWRC